MLGSNWSNLKQLQALIETISKTPMSIMGLRDASASNKWHVTVEWSHGDFMFVFLKCIFILFVIFYSKILVVSRYFHSQALGCCTEYMCDSKLLRSSNTSNINTLLVRTKSELSGWWYNIYCHLTSLLHWPKSYVSSQLSF